MQDVETYAAPRTLEEATELLARGGATILAGGTDLMPQSQTGRVRLRPLVVNIRRVAGLSGICESEGGIRIGALTTITELCDSEMVKSKLHALWQACDQFASDQLRNAGTIGGNICNASPAGDTLPPLLVHDARVELASNRNGGLVRRSMPLQELLAGPGRTRAGPGELLTAVEIPLPRPGFESRSFKFGTRPALDISTISIGFGAVRAGSSLRDVRVAFGAVAPTAVRAGRTEAALEGRPLDAATIAAALAAAEADIRPISDVRASDWYRRELVRNMLQRMLSDVGDR